MGDIAQRGNRLTFAKGGKVNTRRENRLEELGRVDAEKAYSRKGKRNLREEKHRIRSELKKGGRPWGTGPKPGTIEFLQHHTQTPKRKGKAVGGAIAKGIGALAKKFKKKKVYPETEDLTHQKGPYVGDVGSEGKKAKKFAKRSHKKEEEAQRKKNIAWPVRGSYAMAGHVLKGAKKAFKRITHEVPTGPHTDVRRRELNKKWQRKKAAEGGRIGLKKGGSDKKWIQKAVNPKHKGYCTPITKKTCTPARKALARTFKKKAKTGW